MSKISKVKRSGKAKDAIIEAKDQRWHCRNRITLVFGSNDIEDLDTYLYEKDSLEFTTVKFHQAKSKAIEEILDNCIDEYYRGHVTEIHTTLSSDGKTVTVQDNGIGFPLDKIEQVYSEFRTGSKFKDEEVDEKGFLHRTLGQNGLGAAATCLTSDSFKATVRHYNTKKERTVEFIDGALKTKKTRPKPYKKGPAGVTVTLTLAKEVYKDITIDENLLRKRIIDLAYNNPGLAFYFNKEKYLYKKGLFELAQRIGKDNAQNFAEDKFTYEATNTKGKKVKGRIDFSLSLVIDPKDEDREKFISFVNSTPTFDGGFHQDRVRRIFINAVKDKLERQAKKEKVTMVDNDVLTGLTFVLGITMPNPRFESQTKRKLVRDTNLEKAIEKIMEKNIKRFLNKNKDYLEEVMERAKSRHRFQELKDATKKSKKQKKQRVEKLLDANERRDREKCTLFICEGDSAIGGLRSARDKLYQGGIALKGKPMNVAQATLKDVMNNQEFANIMASIGLVIGHPAEIENLRYSKIVFLADSDVDGGHINTLLTNFFYQFWPELFDMGAIQIAKAPLFEVVTDKETVYAETPHELESIKKKHKIKEIHRNKGLGEMSPDAWKYVMSRDSYTRIEVADKKEAKAMLDVCFGKDTGKRKDLLLEDGQTSVTGSTRRKPTRAAKTAKTAKKAAKKTTKKSRVTTTKRKTAKKKTTKTAPKKTTKRKVKKKTTKKKKKR